MPSASGALDALLRSHDLAVRLRPHLARVHWAETVGAQVAGVTQVERVQDGTVLVVRVRNSVWANELSLLKEDMIRRLNVKLGGRVLTDIRFKASGLSKVAPIPSAAPSGPTPGELKLVPVPRDVAGRVEDIVAELRDEHLRDSTRRALLRAARLNGWRRGQGWLPCVRCGTLAPPIGPLSVLCDLCRVGVQ